MEKEVEVNGKKYTLKEFKYKDIANLADVSKAEASKVLMQSSTGMTDEEYDNLSMRDGVEIMKVINEINGLESDFQVPPTPK